MWEVILYFSSVCVSVDIINRCGYMLESVNPNTHGEQSSLPITRLQRAIDVSHLVCHNDISTGIYVPSYSIIANMHGLC